ncbi:hypothetical protein R3P38DRAFT_3113879, partial [Favolaschia claudopus]
MDSGNSRFEPLGGILPGLSTTVNVTGGSGGPGGRGGQAGSAGGNGEGPHLNFFSSAVVNVRRDGLNYSGDQDSHDDFNFRRIRWGDVFLQRQLYVDRQSDRPRFCLDHDRHRSSVRIVRSAKIDGRKFTVASYEGKNAETEWKDDVERYMEIRHESLLQLYGIVRSRNIYAAVFHGDFIPFKDLLQNYQHSAILSCYIYSYVAHDLKSADNYLDNDYDDSVSSDDSYESIYPCKDFINGAMLIDCSNGRLSIDLAGPDNSKDYRSIPTFRFRLDEPLSRNSMEILSSTDFSYIAKTMTLHQYHQYLTRNYESLSKLTWYSVVPSAATVHLGGVYSGRNDNSLEVVALQPLLYDHDIHSQWEDELEGYGRRSWRRISYSEGNEFTTWRSRRHTCTFKSSFGAPWQAPSTAWLSQANHIFGRLNGKPDFHKYDFIVEEISFVAELGRVRNHSKPSPDGFLFLCPKRDFLQGPTSFKWPPPESCWYWSLCPSGMPELSQEEATKLGFPTIQLVTEIRVQSWDDSVYVGLREFHKGSGFDPESQDLAVGLNEPLCELFSDQQ